MSGGGLEVELPDGTKVVHSLQDVFHHLPLGTWHRTEPWRSPSARLTLVVYGKQRTKPPPRVTLVPRPRARAAQNSFDSSSIIPSYADCEETCSEASVWRY